MSGLKRISSAVGQKEGENLRTSSIGDRTPTLYVYDQIEEVNDMSRKDEGRCLEFIRSRIAVK